MGDMRYFILFATLLSCHADAPALFAAPDDQSAPTLASLDSSCALPPPIDLAMSIDLLPPPDQISLTLLTYEWDIAPLVSKCVNCHSNGPASMTLLLTGDPGHDWSVLQGNENSFMYQHAVVNLRLWSVENAFLVHDWYRSGAPY